jgi:drug/metabolite transporter (DMT)-like permease
MMKGTALCLPVPCLFLDVEGLIVTSDATRLRQGMLFIIGSVTGYSILPVFTKNILASGMEPPDIAFWRFFFAAPIFWLYTWLENGRSLAARHGSPPLPRAILLLLGSLLALAAVTAFFGLEIMPAGTFVVLFYTYPAIIAVISLFLGDRLPLQGWIALGLTIVGVIIVTPDFSAGLAGSNFTGVLLALLNAANVAVYFILNSRVLQRHRDKTRASAYIVTGALLALAIFALMRGGVSLPNSLNIWLLLVALATLSTVFPVFCLTNGIARLGAARASIMGSFEPLLTAFWAMLFLGETMQAQQWLGGLVIVAAVILLNLRRPARLRPAAASAD